MAPGLVHVSTRPMGGICLRRKMEAADGGCFPGREDSAEDWRPNEGRTGLKEGGIWGWVVRLGVQSAEAF